MEKTFLFWRDKWIGSTLQEVFSGVFSVSILHSRSIADTGRWDGYGSSWRVENAEPELIPKLQNQYAELMELLSMKHGHHEHGPYTDTATPIII